MASTSQISPILIKKTNDFKGLTESNHLATNYLTQPKEIDGLLNYLMVNRKQSSIMSLLAGSAKMDTLEVDNREYQWRIYASTDRAIEIVEDTVADQPGIGNLPFQIKSAENYYDATDVLNLDDGSQVRIREDATQEGNAWVYTVEKIDPDPENFIDPEMLRVGHRVAKDFSAVEEFSHRGGQTTFATPMLLRNHLTTIRKKLSVTRSAATDAMVIQIPDPNNPKKMTQMWMRYAEWTFLQQVAREKEFSMIYSKYNKGRNGEVVLEGDNSRPVYIGAGFREQISPSNRRYYNDELTYQFLFDYLSDLAYCSNEWGYDADFIVLTGREGTRMIDRAVRNELSAQVTVVNQDLFTTSNGQELTYKGQFTHIKFLNGITLKVQHFPAYDDITRNRQLHPRTKRPIESYRMTFMNFANRDGEPNIRRVVKKNSDDLLWHVAGSIDPMGTSARSNTSRASSVDGFEVHALSECGICLTEPRSCGELLYGGDPVYL